MWESKDQFDFFDLFDLEALESEGLESWLSQTLVKCAQWFEASGASVFLREPDGMFHLRSSTGGLSNSTSGARIELGRGLAGMVLLDGEARIMGELAADSRFEVRSEITSSMIIPLFGSGGEPIGVMNFSRKRGEPDFVQDDLEQISTVADHIALAVGNAQLHALLRESLRESERRAHQLQIILDHVASQVWEFDNRGEVQTGNFACNETHEAIETAIENVLVTGRQFELRAVSQDSEQTWLIRAVPTPGNGGIVTVQDISDFQRAQNEAGRLRRLAEIGQMTATIAHEIRNPLTGIRGAAQLIASDSSFAPEYSRVIEEEVLKLEALCNDFLDISKPLKIEQREVSLNEISKSVCDLWHPEFETKAVGLILKCDEDMPTILGDRRRVEQVLHNLLRNALQASTPGTKVHVVVHNLQIRVQDEGVGMSDEHIARLFSPFFTTKSDGTGLGLCNVRRILDAHGGSISVQSELGRGTTFELTFPGYAA